MVASRSYKPSVDQCARWLKPPAYVRDRVRLGVSERAHVFVEQICVQASVNPGSEAILDGQFDTILNVALLRQQDVSAIDHDAPISAAFIRESQCEAARPVIPPPRFIDETVFCNRLEFAYRAVKVRPCSRNDVHLAGPVDTRLCGEYALAIGQTWHEPRKHLGWLDREQDLGASLQDIELFG